MDATVKLDVSQFSTVKIEGVNTLIAEISELELKKVPVYLMVKGRESRVFGPAEERLHGGEVISWIYPQADRSELPICVVEVLND